MASDIDILLISKEVKPQRHGRAEEIAAVKKKSEEVLMVAKDFIKWWFKL